jgi:AraC family transcriptional activator of pyochelin receptor
MAEAPDQLTTFDLERVRALSRGEVHTFDSPLDDREGELKILITDTLGVVDGNMHAKRLGNSMTHKNESDFVEMNFMMEGHIAQTYDGLFTKFPYHKGYHNILFNPFASETNEIMKTGHHRIFSVHMLKEKMSALFNEYLPGFGSYGDKVLKGERFVIHSPTSQMSARLQSAIHSFWTHTPPSNLGKLYYESRVLELLAWQCEGLSNDTCSKVVALPKSDIEKLHYAREILTRCLDRPPTLSALALMVGLNEYKLKRYFQELFQTSVYGYVSQARLAQAREMIMEREKNISTIAYELGYAHPQHFHRAFKKQFGVTPRSLLK